MTPFQKKLDSHKRSATLHLLFKCSRLLNERAIATLPHRGPGKTPRAAHLALFPHIELAGGTRMTELAEKLGISKQAVGQLVDDLEQWGQVARVADPDDGRAKRVVFTDQGKSSMLDGLRHLKNVEDQLAHELGTDLIESLRGSLLVLHDHLLRG